MRAAGAAAHEGTGAIDRRRTTAAERVGRGVRVRSERSTAITVGMLYIAATLAGAAASAFAGSPGGLAGMAAGPSQVLATAFLELVMAISVAGTALMLYPVLMQDADTPAKQGLALWYVGTRVTEGTLFVVGVLVLLAQLALSRELAGAGPGAVVQSQAVGAVLKAMFDYSWVLGQTVFCVGAAMLYYLLYVSKRVPRWIAVWGLVAAPLMLVGGLLLPFTGDPNSTISTVLYVPMGLQEMVLAIWLIGWGFASSAQAQATGR